ncbi:SGNH/GDSL hydrolase family protein [Massilia sp. TN1-12]|uniref:SGNH/GDSL hydrolase family protein n=1 Tax=Massilia paldalensis TaxID=3377675 RepID=UPI0038507E7A
MTRNRKTNVIGAMSLVLAGMMANASAEGERYVSMGSSYAAGPGVGQRDTASGGCGRSLTNYARTVAQKRHLDLVDVACSGATTENILVRGQHGFPAQIEAVTPDTRLVTILIGGNDIGYVGDLFGFSCRSEGKGDCKVSDTAQLEQRFAALPASLDRVIAAVRKRAPDARIVLVGYLPAVPEDAGKTCAALPLARDEAQRMRATTTRLTQVFEAAATRNRIALVQASALGASHDACARDNYITGYRPARVPSWDEPVGYHPTQAGMDRIAQELDRILSQ